MPFSMTPLEQYKQAVSSGRWVADPAQLAVMEHLQAIYDGKQDHQGLYIWGSVGIGKTDLMDMFYQCVSGDKKLRLHFHRFMREVHAELTRLQGQKNPLKMIAENFAKKANIICFDEFIVNDITDAMLLGELFKYLFERKIILIATSNTAPDNLYHNGLQRGRFLPAIELIKKNTIVLHMETKIDYRQRALESAGVYFFPQDVRAEKQMESQFSKLAQGPIEEGGELIIEGRAIQTVRYTDDIVWFTFDNLCQVPRSQRDYLEITKDFSTVFLSHVPKISAESDHHITYLINLVDIFYDARVKLVISAAVSIPEIYTEGRLLKDFQRTRSRLLEMQSHHYLGLPHVL